MKSKRADNKLDKLRSRLAGLTTWMIAWGPDSRSPGFVIQPVVRSFIAPMLLREHLHLVTRCLRTLRARLPFQPPLVAARGAREGLWLEQGSIEDAARDQRRSMRACLALRPGLPLRGSEPDSVWQMRALTGDARPRFFESYALLEEQVRRARSDDGRL